MAKRSKSQNSRKRALNAFEIAGKELGGDTDSENDYPNDPRRNGAIVNPQRRDSDDEGEDDFEDEELDSDEALGSEDDYDVLNSKFSQTIRDIKKQKGPRYEEESEEEGGYTSIDEEELVPLSQVWDMDDKASRSDDVSQDDNNLELNDDLSDNSSSEGDESSEDEDDEDDDKDPFDEVSADEDVELTTIANSLRKDTEKAQYKRLDNYAGGDENEFALPSASSGKKKLNLADMLSVVEDKEATEKASLIKGKPETLAVPLPQRIQKRHERKAAYEISRDEVNKWKEVVQQNRQAEHLSFPLNPATHHNEASAFTRASEKPMTELEEKVSQVLKESNLVDPQKESTFEEIATAKLSPEEMRKRTAELRLMRELMFREERKAKRIKKIKSKAYHRIKKKELLKNKELIDDSDESDTDREAARAKERMSLKHKTTSKWAKDMIKHGMTKDKDTREEMEEMLRQGERLKAKIVGHESGEESDSGVSDIENDYKTIDSDKNFDQRDKVGKTGVLNMPFMKNAEARQKEANREDIAKLRAAESDQDVALFEEDSQNRQTGANFNVNQGRRIYTPGVVELREEMKIFDDGVLGEHAIDESRALEKRISKAHEEKPSKKGKVTNNSDGKNAKVKYTPSTEETTTRKAKRPEGDADEEANPWLDDSDTEEYIKKSTKVSVVDENSSKFTKSANKIEKEKAKQTKKGKNRKRNDEELLLDIEDSNKLNIVDPYGGSDDEQGNVMFKQQDVIAEAFAGDDVVEKFEQEKKRVAIDEDDKEEDVTLPGWGDWAGAGANPKKKRKFIKKTKGVVEKDKRKDKNLKNVIINEKVNKKNLKYQSSAVPFPFESREQYERSLRMPLGQEWTSRTSHQKLIKPRIMTKPGTVIDPLKAPFK